MEIDPALFCVNLFLYYYEEKYLSSPISFDKIIDDLCAINDGGELGRSFCNIYPKELELKVE